MYSPNDYVADKEDEEHETFDGIAKNRETTNRPILIFMAIVFIVTLGFVGYSLTTGKMARIIRRYDDCGNLCGKVNPPNPILKAPCTNKDLTGIKYLHISNTSEGIMKECVDKCPSGDFIKRLNICVNKNVNIDLNEFKFDIPWLQFIACTGISLVLTILLFILFRKATKYYVWFTIILGVAINIAICVYCWVLYAKYKKEQNTFPENSTKYREVAGNAQEMLFVGVMATIGVVAQVILIMFLFKRIRFLIMLFKEASKVIIDIPLIVLQSLYTIIVLILVTSLYAYFNAVIWSSMSLKPVENTNQYASHDKYEYSIGALQIAGFAVNFFAFLWMWQFVIDCQYFIVASSVSKWFFARDKSRLESPIMSSYKTLLGYHLGTIAFGSLIITLIRILRMIIQALKKCAKDSNNVAARIALMCLDCIVSMIEHILQVITKNAYIVTAIYGYSFMPAGKKAFHLLTSNFNSTIAIDSIGDTVIFVSKFLVVLISAAIGFVWLNKSDYDGAQFFIGFLLIIIFSFVIVDSFLDIIGITVDAIFLCFCIDAESNDGVERPYFMSTRLMEFMEQGKKYAALKEEEKKKKEREAGENSD